MVTQSLVMTQSQLNFRDMAITHHHIYQISKLFYAIALSDSRLHEIEKDIVTRSIKEYREFLEYSDPSSTDHNVNPAEIFHTIGQEDSGAWELFDGFEM